MFKILTFCPVLWFLSPLKCQISEKICKHLKTTLLSLIYFPRPAGRKQNKTNYNLGKKKNFTLNFSSFLECYEEILTAWPLAKENMKQFFLNMWKLAEKLFWEQAGNILTTWPFYLDKLHTSFFAQLRTKATILSIKTILTTIRF